MRYTQPPPEIARVLVDEYDEGSDGHGHAALHRGAMASLDAHARFWGGARSCVVRWRQPEQWACRLAARAAIYRPQVRALARGL